MKKIFVLLLALAMIPAVQSCKKKEKEPEPSAKELITMDDWTWVKREMFNNAGDLIISVNPNTKWVLTSSNDFYFYDSSGDLLQYGTWQLLDDDTKIRFIEHNGSYDNTYEINELTEDSFKFSGIFSGNKHVYYLER